MSVNRSGRASPIPLIAQRFIAETCPYVRDSRKSTVDILFGPTGVRHFSEAAAPPPWRLVCPGFQLVGPYCFSAGAQSMPMWLGLLERR